MKLHNSGLCDYCGETEAIGNFLIDCTGNGVARNIKNACEKLQLGHNINYVLNDILFATFVDPSCSPHLCKVGDLSPSSHGGAAHWWVSD